MEALYIKYLYLRDKILTYLWGPKVNNNGIIVSYYYKYKWHNIYIPIVKKKREVIEFCTNKIHDFLGPNRDFHNQSYRPLDFQLEEVTVTIGENSKTYSREEVIKLEF